MLTKGRPLHARPRGTGAGNWLWLPTGAIAVAVILTVLVVTRATPACAPAAPAGGPARPAGPALSADVAGVGGPRGGVTPSGVAGPGASFRSVKRAGEAGGKRSRTVTGTARFYVPGAAAGACDLGPFRRDGVYASLSPARFARGTDCGTYVHVRGPRGEVLAEVVDLCPLCAGDDINLSRAAFAKVAPTRRGSARVSYAPATDPRLPGPLTLRGYRTADGYRALQVLNHGNRIVAVDITAAAPGRTRRWHRMRLSAHDLWVAWGRRVPQRVTVRLSDDRGHTVVIRGVRLRPGREVSSAVWMYPRAGVITVIPPALAPRPVTHGPRRVGAGLIVIPPLRQSSAASCPG